MVGRLAPVRGRRIRSAAVPTCTPRMSRQGAGMAAGPGAARRPLQQKWRGQPLADADHASPRSGRKTGLCPVMKVRDARGGRALAPARCSVPRGAACGRGARRACGREACGICRAERVVRVAPRLRAAGGRGRGARPAPSCEVMSRAARPLRGLARLLHLQRLARQISPRSMVGV